MQTKYLDKFLEKHKDTCAYWIFSGDRHCSCGRDSAKEELADIVKELLSIHETADSLFHRFEDFTLSLCDLLGISYEDVSQAEIVQKISSLKLRTDVRDDKKDSG